MFRNILVCVDDSPQADEALAQAIDLADCQHSRLTILTAIPRPPTWLATPMTAASVEPLGADLRAEAQKVLCQAVDRVPDCVPVTKILSEAPIRDAHPRHARAPRTCATRPRGQRPAGGDGHAHRTRPAGARAP